MDPSSPLFARAAGPGDEASPAWRGKEEIEALRDEAAVLKTNPAFDAPQDFAAALKELLRGDGFPLITAELDGA